MDFSSIQLKSRVINKKEGWSGVCQAITSYPDKGAYVVNKTFAKWIYFDRENINDFIIQKPKLLYTRKS